MIAYEEYTKRLDVLTFDTSTSRPDIENIYKNDIDTMELEDFKTYVYNIEPKTLAAYNNLCMREAHNIRPTTILVHPETSLEDRLCNIETLLTETETFRDMARQCEYTQRTNKLIEEVKTTLLDIEASHGVNINNLWDSLDHDTLQNETQHLQA